MEINPSSMSGLSAGAAQMQARFEMAQSQRSLNDAQAAAGRAQKEAGAPEASDAAKAASYQKLVKVSRDFESIFLSYMLKTMRDTVPKDALLGNSQESDIFNAMHDDELAKNLSQAGGIGLGKLMVEQLKKTI